MSQAVSDDGIMHSETHKHYTSRGYRYDDVDDPPGEAYRLVKKELQDALEPASFQTVWKCFCVAEIFIDKAFTESNVLSALKSCGICPRDNLRILGKNPEFASLSESEAGFVVATIQYFSRVVDRRAFVPEEEFDEMFDGEINIDTIPHRVGMRLNAMSTNRQRAMIDNDPKWIEELEARDAAALAADQEKERIAAEKAAKVAATAAAVAAGTARPPNDRSCSNLGCPNKIAMNKKVATWSKCTTKGCRVWACHLAPCVAALHHHTIICA